MLGMRPAASWPVAAAGGASHRRGAGHHTSLFGWPRCTTVAASRNSGTSSVNGAGGPASSSNTKRKLGSAQTSNKSQRANTQQPAGNRSKGRQQLQQVVPATASADHVAELRKNPDLYSMLDGSSSSSSSSSTRSNQRTSIGASGSLPKDDSSSVTLQLGLSSHGANPLDSSSSSTGVVLPNGVVLQHRPEVLAPVGGWPQLHAAVENGADAVYFGVSDFNARARAANFDPEELPQVMEYLHARGVKGYVAVNILVFDRELTRLEQRIRQMAQAGVDAVIVQDLGVVSLIRRVAPSLPIHGSTQMTITSPEGAQFAAGLGVTRVVVGRELSVREISTLSAACTPEVEAFCHGALCVSYSGQCFSSEAWGGRSANRGQCAQACRLPYGLVVNGQLKDLGDLAYLLSPQDLAAVEQVPDMVAAGVTCFKIEGRLKGPEYVALTTRVYREAVDAAWDRLLEQQQQEEERQAGHQQQEQQDASGAQGSTPAAVVSRGKHSRGSQQRLVALQQLFARGQDATYGGLTPGFLEGPQHQMLVRGRNPRHRGVCLGEVSAVTQRGVVIRRLLQPVKRGDGLVFDQGRPQEAEEGGQVYAIYNATKRLVQGESAAGSDVELVFGPGQVNLRRVAPGDLLWRNKDPALEGQVRATYASVSSTTARKLPVAVAVRGELGQPLQLELRDAAGRCAAADSGEQVLQAARKAPMTEGDVQAAVGQLGDNSLAAASWDLSGLRLDQGLFLPASALKAVRRAAAEQLLLLQQQHGIDAGLAAGPVLPELLEEAQQRELPAPAAGVGLAAEQQAESGAAASTSGRNSDSSSSSQRSSRVPSASPVEPVLRVLCRTPQQVEAALRVPWLSEIILDFLEVHGLKEAVAAVQAGGKRAVAALPRIFKPDEERLLNFYLRLQADALLIRSTGALHQLQRLGGPGAVVPGLQPWSRNGGSSNTSAHDGVQDAAGGTPSTAITTSSRSSSSSQGGEQHQGAAVRVPALEGDFSLNVANLLSADLLLTSSLSRLAPTHDLNGRQLVELGQCLQGAGRSAALEAIVHQHLPIFHTEHCVFCRFLSDGNSYKDCGHPCESNVVHLRDQSSADHLVLADMGCRNTVFNAQAQSGVYYLKDLAAAGYGAFRVELVDEPAEVVPGLLEGYREVLQGRKQPGQLWGWLAQLPDANGRVHGVSAGSLEVVKEREAGQMKPTASALKAARQL